MDASRFGKRPDSLRCPFSYLLLSLPQALTLSPSLPLSFSLRRSPYCGSLLTCVGVGVCMCASHSAVTVHHTQSESRGRGRFSEKNPMVTVLNHDHDYITFAESDILARFR